MCDCPRGFRYTLLCFVFDYSDCIILSLLLVGFIYFILFLFLVWFGSFWLTRPLIGRVISSSFFYSSIQRS